MTRDEAVAQIKQGLGFRSNLDSTIVIQLQIQQSLLELSPTKPWFLLSEWATRSTVSGEQRVPLPTDFLDEYEEGCLTYVPASAGEEEIDLKKDTVDVLRANYRTEAPGEPEAYALSGAYFLLYPVPDAAYTLRMKYYQKAQLLTTNIENEWLKWVPTLLIGRAGSVVAAGLRDFKAKELFDTMAREAVLLLENQNEARKHANYDMQVGGPH